MGILKDLINSRENLIQKGNLRKRKWRKRKRKWKWRKRKKKRKKWGKRVNNHLKHKNKKILDSKKSKIKNNNN